MFNVQGKRFILIRKNTILFALYARLFAILRYVWCICAYSWYLQHRAHGEYGLRHERINGHSSMCHHRWHRHWKRRSQLGKVHARGTLHVWPLLLHPSPGKSYHDFNTAIVLSVLSSRLYCLLSTSENSILRNRMKTKWQTESTAKYISS